MRSLLRTSAGLAMTISSDVVMLMWTDGGQGTARRNAWVSMVDDSKRSRERAAVAASLLAVAGQVAPVSVAALPR